MMRVSIVITNYNFGQFLPDAIQSALDVRWPDKEVIVCDDGSTDNSRTVIESFSDQIIAIYKANGGQPSAANAAFASITGDIIFFLDSDDLLLPQAAEVVTHVWDKETAKVQFPMIVIDQDGVSNGKVGLAPRSLALRAIRARYVAQSRSKVLELILSLAGAAASRR